MSHEQNRIAFTCWLVLSVVLVGGCRENRTADQPAAQAAGQADQRTANHASSPSQSGIDDTLRTAKRFAASGDVEKVRELSRQILLQAADAPPVQWELVSILRGLKLHSDASNVIEHLPADAIIQMHHVPEAFDSLLQSKRYDQAESFLQECIDTKPESPEAHRLMAQLLNSQGRRFEASQHVQELIRLRSITRHELLSLIDISGPYLLVDFRSVIGSASTTLFGMNEARRLWFSSRPDRPQAIQLLEQIDQSYRQHPAYVSLALRFYAENGQWERFDELLAQRPANIDQFPDYWQAIGTWYFNRSEMQNAAAAWIECLKLDPTNRSVLRTLIASQDSLDEDSALVLQSWLADLDKLFRIARDATPDQAIWIASTLQSRIRPWEATAWTKISAHESGRFASVSQELDATQAQIMQWEAKYSQDEIRLIRLQQNLPAKLQDLVRPIVPRAHIATTAKNAADRSPEQQTDRVFRFDAVANRLGINTSYVSHYPASGSDFFVYQANGGGLAAIDYDLDGNLDVYVVQAGGEPHQQNSVANQTFRQIDDHFVETTEVVRAGDLGYGQGVCVGDVNQDGFPDIIVANIGNNVILINQGDGTFLQRDDLIEHGKPSWTSSIGLADLNGDHLPDLVEVNYIDDPTALTARCNQPFQQCQPQSFDSAEDRFYRLRRDGTFESIDEQNQNSFLVSDTEPRLGFGLIIANFDDRCGNDIFISNDGDLNHFWQSTCETRAQTANQAASLEQLDTAVGDHSLASAPYRLAESAALAGCAVGRLGNAQACMGIAAGDLDGDGRLDLHVCNFFGESSNLFLQQRRGFFSDDVVRRGIEPLSKQRLGFGTQAADFDNDGRLDLFVLNGHLFNQQDDNEPFRMNPQLLAGNAAGFYQAKVESDAEHDAYWDRPALGRTVVVGDFNRDGQMDLLCNHLDQPVELLQNQTPGQGRSITLELVGVTSERDAIGAKVTVVAGKDRHTAWMIGGDGYMCSNEAIVHVGLGLDCESVERIEIDWPSGKHHQFTNLIPDQRYLIVEGATQVFTRQDE